MSDDTGFAMRRNGSCLSTETDCGPTTFPFRGCCPGGTFCPNAYNVKCCPNADCDGAVRNSCANSEANLYTTDTNITRGGFCCEQSSPGFMYTDGNGAGCAENGTLVLSSGISPLQILASATTSPTPTPTPTPSLSTSTSASASQSASTTASVSSSPSPSPINPTDATSPSTNNTGAIAGGVVGGVAGVAILLAAIWLLWRRHNKRNSKGGLSSIEISSINNHAAQKYSQQSNSVSQSNPSELDAMHDTPIAELHGGTNK